MVRNVQTSSDPRNLSVLDVNIIWLECGAVKFADDVFGKNDWRWSINAEEGAKILFVIGALFITSLFALVEKNKPQYGRICLARDICTYGCWKFNGNFFSRTFYCQLFFVRHV